MAGRRVEVILDGHVLTLTNLNKVFYPVTGTTKRDVIDYYRHIAPILIAHAHDRPATRKRWVDGVGTEENPGPVFFQRNLEAGTPDWVPRGRVQHKDHVNLYPLVNDSATLVWLAQTGTLEIHTPQWRLGAQDARSNPDRLVLDLDPGTGVGLAACAAVARLTRDYLRDKGLDPIPLTSGSKGIHVYARLDGHRSSDEVSEAAHVLARALEADHPDLVVSSMKKSVRAGKVFIDWSQNNAAKTTVAPYSLRGRTRPTVAVPRTWRELASAHLAQLDYRDVLHRLDTRGDPLASAAIGRMPDDVLDG